MRKKVLFVITKSNWGGAQRYVYDLAIHLPQETFDPVVALGGSGMLKTRLEEAGIRTIPIPSLDRDVSVMKELQSLKFLWHLFHQEHPNIIHLNSSKIGGLGSVVALIYKIATQLKFYYTKFLLRDLAKNQLQTKHYQLKTIFTVHGWAFNEDRHRAVRYVIRLLQWVTVWFCHHVIIISNRDFRQALHLPLVKRKKFIFIPLGIPQENLSFLPRKAAKKELAARIKIPARNLNMVVGTIAELTHNKGLKYLIDAIAQLQTKGYKLQTVIVGEGEEREKLETLLRQHNLQETVYLAGFIPDAAQYLKAFDVFVLSSLKEGLPYTILEAMHAGVPVVGSRVGGIPDLIEQEGTGIIVPPKNPQDIANAVGRLLSDKTLHHKLGKQAQKRAQERFSFDAMFSATIRLYNGV